MKRESRFETSNDFQLPPGELWWAVSFEDKLFRLWGLCKPKPIIILFCMPKEAQTWYQANQKAQIMIREYFGGDCQLPGYSVKLWESD